MDITKIANLILLMLEKKVLHTNNKKLSILLFLIDFKSLEKNNQKIFKEDYIKASRHPEPKILREIFDIIANQEDLEDDDQRLYIIQELLDFVDIEITNKKNFIELEFIKCEEEFDHTLFSKKEFLIIEEVLSKYKNSSVRNIANDCFKIDKMRETPKGEVII